MTRYIDADALAEQYTEMVERLLPKRRSIVPSDVTTLIVNAPTMDAVEVVRCENCRKQGSDDCPMFNREWRTIVRGDECVDDFIFHDLTKPSGFCNYGERNTNE